MPTQDFPPSIVPMSQEMQSVCDREVADLLDNNAIIEITDGS